MWLDAVARVDGVTHGASSFSRAVRPPSGTCTTHAWGIDP